MPWQREWGRDPRLDFFRGIAMIIIFLSHVPGNWSIYYINGGYGPSDAAEIFVFCSGFAAAIAFGGTFRRFGFWTGVRRVLYRCWQIYWAHISLFLILMALCVVATWLFPDYQDVRTDRIAFLGPPNTSLFWEETDRAVVGLLTLTWIPNWFNILPLYFALLLMMPLFLLLVRIRFELAVAVSFGLYLATWFLNLELTSDADLDKHWFFNPFAWQLLFYTGFALSSGLIRMPRPNKWLILAAITYVLILMPLTARGLLHTFPVLEEIRAAVYFFGDYNPSFLTGEQKSDLHPLRYLHFLCLAYLATCALWGRERVLLHPRCAPIMKVGQQALSTYMTGLVLSWMGGVFIEQVGRTPATAIFVNLVGIAALIAVAYTVSWYKAAPWTRKSPKPAVHLNDPASSPRPVSVSDPVPAGGTSRGLQPVPAAGD